MNAAKQALLILIALVSLVGSAWYFASEKTPLTKHPETLSTMPDTTIHQLVVKQFDVNGRLQHCLKTPLVHHIPANNTHVFTTPYITVSQANQPDWEISAHSATSERGGEKITFHQQVTIHQNKTTAHEASTLTTEEMTYFPKDKFATTLAQVIFEQQPGNIVQSKGMNAYLDEKRVQLLSQARGTYAPSEG